MARRNGIVWRSNPIPRNLRNLAVELPMALDAIMEYQAPLVQSHARTNAPWTDRTSTARNGLMAQPFTEASGPGRDTSGRFTKGSANHGIVLFHSVPYGIWLETRFSGKYAIILPTIEVKGPDVMRMVNKLMGRI